MAGIVDVRERYRLLAKLGSGGMADVFLAVQLGAEDFRRLVVLKRIHSRWLGQPDSHKMFIEEAQVAASLSHPHIVKIFDLSWMGSDICIAMEYIDGESLAYLIKTLRSRGERIPLPVVFKLMVEACEALTYLHAATSPNGHPLNLVHRDICPQNLLFDSNGYLKVIDFGIARSIAGDAQMTSPGMLQGKLPYLAPEMLQRAAVDGRADLYALGLVMFELMTLRPAVPFETEVPVAEVMNRITAEPIPRVSDLVPDLDPRLDNLIARATHKEPVERFQTGAGFATEVRRVAEGLGGIASTSEIDGWLRETFPARIAQRREFEREAMAKAGGPPSLDGRDTSPRLVTDRTADLGAFAPDLLVSQPIGSTPRRRANPYIFAVVIFALITAGLVVFRQLFWNREAPPTRQASVYLVSDNLFVRSTPPGATIRINGEEVGTTGSSGLNLRVTPGRDHIMNVDLEGHEPYSLRFTGESFGQRSIHARLVPLAPGDDLEPTRRGRKRRGRLDRKRGKTRGALASAGPLAGRRPSAPASEELSLDELVDEEAEPATEAEPEPEWGPEPEVEPEPEPEVAPAPAPVSAPPPAETVPSAPVAAKKAPPVIPKEPVPQTTAEVMRRRTGGKAPEYPRWALVDGIETTMVVRVVITRSGRIEDVQYVSGDRGFRTEVQRALRTWRFRPYVVGGRKLTTTAELRLAFKLDN